MKIKLHYLLVVIRTVTSGNETPTERNFRTTLITPSNPATTGNLKMIGLRNSR